MRTLKLILSYDGTGYRGWQIQPNGRSIQQELTDAIEKVTGKVVNLVASSRTDAGVHALGQVVHFRTDSRLQPRELLRALNANLPDQIVIQSVSEVEESFDAASDAKWKLYRYFFYDGPLREPFLRSYCWQVHGRLDVSRMRQAAGCLEGTHDFRCFETDWPTRTSSVRTIQRCQPTRLGHFVYLDVQANGFLYNMVRSIAGTLWEVGRGRWPPEQVEEVLRSGERVKAGPTAPAQGLFLVRVDY